MTKEQQFEAFWKSYPRRVAKGAARKAFEKAIKKTDLENMLKAISEYVAKKPEKIDFKHPATWLNGECWDDEWEPPQARAPAFIRGPSTNEQPVQRREPETPEQRANRLEMASRLRLVASSMRAPQ